MHTHLSNTGETKTAPICSALRPVFNRERLFLHRQFWPAPCCSEHPTTHYTDQQSPRTAHTTKPVLSVARLFPDSPFSRTKQAPVGKVLSEGWTAPRLGRGAAGAGRGHRRPPRPSRRPAEELCPPGCPPHLRGGKPAAAAAPRPHKVL